MYCLNDPISGYDPTGEWGWKSIGLLVAGIAVAAAAATFVACTGGVVIGIIGASTEVVKSVVVAGIAAGTMAGTKKTVDQLWETNGDEIDPAETIETVANETCDAMIEKLVFCGSSKIEEFASEHEFIYKFTKKSLNICASYAERSIKNSVLGKSNENTSREIFEENLGDMMALVGIHLMKAWFESAKN